MSNVQRYGLGDCSVFFPLNVEGDVEACSLLVIEVMVVSLVDGALLRPLGWEAGTVI